VVKQFRTEHDFVLPAVLRSVGLPLFQQCRRLQLGRQELFQPKSGPWLALKTFLIVYIVLIFLVQSLSLPSAVSVAESADGTPTADLPPPPKTFIKQPKLKNIKNAAN
jgi:hypothetical protein